MRWDIAAFSRIWRPGAVAPKSNFVGRRLFGNHLLDNRLFDNSGMGPLW